MNVFARALNPANSQTRQRKRNYKRNLTRMPEYEHIEPAQLEYFERRDIREPAVEELKEAIEARGYDDGRPLKVVPNGQGFLVADGNHRLRAVEEKGFDRELPCLVYRDGDPVEIGLESNRGEDVYAEEDLFDTLDTIEYLQEERLTQAEIAEVLDDGFEGWSEAKVKQYSALLGNVVTEVLELARSHQRGRVTDEVTSVTFNFTEGWFRNSGLYELDSEWDGKHAQLYFMEWFCEDQNCDVAKNKLTSKVDSLLEIQTQLEYIEDNLNASVEGEDRESLVEDVKSNAYTDEQIEDVVDDLNRGAKNQAHFGSDALEELERIDDNEIDCVVTDPPWGVEFESRRETDNPDYDSTKEETLLYLERVFEQLKRVCKANAHIYVIFPIAHYCEFQELAGQFFDVNEVPLMWVKNNHAPVAGTNGYDKIHARKYEPIYFCRMPNGDQRTLNKDVSPNVLQYARPPGEKRWHDSQKPVPLLEDLITNSTGKHETVLDPFAGSGSTMLAAAKNERHYIGIEKDGSYKPDFEKRVREYE